MLQVPLSLMVLGSLASKLKVEVNGAKVWIHADDVGLSRSPEDTIRVIRPDGSWRVRRKNVAQPCCS